MSAQLDIYVENARAFLQSEDYKLQHMLRAAGGDRLAYRILDRFRPQDCGSHAFLHVDLTVVPDTFRGIEEGYAACVNGRATNISRLLYSTVRVVRGDAYDGPVIVKTVLNHHGWPEVRFESRRTLSRRAWHNLRTRIDTRFVARACPEYSVYPLMAAVPGAVWDDRRLMVERFLPGRLEPPIEKYRYDFFFDVELNIRSTHQGLLCDPENVVGVECFSDVPDAVIAVRRALHFDFGAIDYFMVDDVATVIDANKTVGITPSWVKRFPPVGRHLELAARRLRDFVSSRAT